MKDTITIRNATYEFGNFTDLHLAPIAEFITEGIKKDPDSWSYCAKMLKIIVPSLPDNLVDTTNGQVFLSLKELSNIYKTALAITQRDYVTFSNEQEEDNAFDRVAQLEKELEEAKFKSQVNSQKT